MEMKKNIQHEERRKKIPKKQKTGQDKQKEMRGKWTNQYEKMILRSIYIIKEGTNGKKYIKIE